MCGRGLLGRGSLLPIATCASATSLYIAMDPWTWLILAAFVAGLLMIITAVRGFFTSKSKKPATGNPPEAVRPLGQRAEMAGGMRRTRNVRSRVAAAQRARQAPIIQEEAANDLDTDDDDTGIGGFAEEEDETLKAFSNKKIGTKKLRRLQEKAEKKAQREQEEAMREDKKRRAALKEEERKQELEEERIREVKEEEERQRLKDEQERKEHEEYLKMKEAFVVEEEGEAADQEDEETKTVREFINYIKRHKVVYMEDLAAEFNVKTQEAISRVHSLQESEELTGVVDDRGKFIYISEDELQAVANFIKQRGRVSIVELVSSSNRLINLQPEQTAPSAVTT